MVFGLGWRFSGYPGIGGILWPDFRVSSEIGGICDLILGFLLCRAELGHLCLEGLGPAVQTLRVRV